jgi:hypothetical protein
LSDLQSAAVAFDEAPIKTLPAAVPSRPTQPLIDGLRKLSSIFSARRAETKTVNFMAYLDRGFGPTPPNTTQLEDAVSYYRVVVEDELDVNRQPINHLSHEEILENSDALFNIAYERQTFVRIVETRNIGTDQYPSVIETTVTKQYSGTANEIARFFHCAPATWDFGVHEWLYSQKQYTPTVNCLTDRPMTLTFRTSFITTVA